MIYVVLKALLYLDISVDKKASNLTKINQRVIQTFALFFKQNTHRLLGKMSRKLLLNYCVFITLHQTKKKEKEFKVMDESCHDGLKSDTSHRIISL